MQRAHSKHMRNALRIIRVKCYHAAKHKSYVTRNERDWNAYKVRRNFVDDMGKL